MAMPCLLVFLIVAEIISTISIAEAGYCYRSYVCSYYGYGSQHYTTKCGFMNWQRCGRYRHIGVTYYRTCYQSYCCSGYTGSSCAQAICYGSTSCPNGGACASPNRCVCRPGFTGSKCSDLNECTAGTHNCQQVCINNHGSFACFCKSGFLINGDKKTCTDIDECLENNGGCSQFCQNTDGSYECSCKNGLYLASDGKTCIDTDECSANNGGCEHVCINDFTTFRCACNQGYSIDLDGKSCVDIDECAGPNKCSQQCENTLGLYNCSCFQGFELSDDGVTCLDIDDCVDVSCLHGGSCIDLPSSYQCQCLQGYEGDYCQTDENECLFANGGCEDQCINTNGSFYCQCRENSFLEEDGFSCRGDSDVPSVFQKYQIARRLLPRGCMFVSLMSCKGSETSLNLMLTSTEMWYRLNTNQSILYTYGIVFAEVGDLSVPVSITGMKVILTEKNYDIVTGSVSYKKEDGIALNDRHKDDCLLLNITKKDIHEFISSGSFLGTFFDRMQDNLPFWLRLSKSGVGLISVTDLKTDLVYGQHIDSLPECTGAPVFKDRLYNVFRFGTDMSFSIYGDRIHVPSPLQGKKFCMIIDICQNNGGTIFLMIPQESRNLLDTANLFTDLARKGLRLRPKGIGLSLVNDINVHYKTSELNLWKGYEMFRLRVFQTASIWIDADIDYISTSKSFDVNIYGNTDIFLNVPSITNLLRDLFVVEWNGLVQLRKFTLTPTVRIRIDGMEIELSFKDIVMASLDAYFSIGGDEKRIWCGNNANPPGIFVSFLLDVNPFRHIPILDKWIFDASFQLYAFITTDDRLVLETKTDIIQEILELNSMLEKFRISFDDFTNNIIGEMSSVLQQAIIKYQSSISELQTIMAEILTGGDSLRVILKGVKYSWEKYTKLKKEAIDLLDNLEFHTSALVNDFTDLIESETTRIGYNIDRAISKITDQIFSLVDSYTGVGFRFRSFVKIFVLEFDIMEIEIIHSVKGMAKCSKFKKVYELISDLEAFRVVAHTPTITGSKISFVYDWDISYCMNVIII